MSGDTSSTATADRLLYIRDVAKRYGVCTKTVRRLVTVGKIPAPLAAKFGNGPCWRESDINRHLESLK